MRSCLVGALAIGLIAGATGAAAQEGRVFVESTETPVPLADIVWRASADGPWAARVQSDLAGRFEVPASWTGGFIEVRALGYAVRSLSRADAAAAGWRIALVADPLELETVVVTASGRAQRRSEVAVALLTVSEQDIQASGAPSAVEILEEVPGIQSVSGVPAGSNIQIRGIGDARVLVLVDGQPTAGALLENRDLSRLSLAGVERIEVVKGPLSSLYGSDALGGVINIITSEPDPGLVASARVSSAGGGRHSADATVSGGGTLRTRHTLSWRQQDEVPGLNDADAFARVWDLRSTLRYGQADGLSVRTDLNLVRERQRWPTGGGFNGFNDNRGVTAWTEARYQSGSNGWSLRLLGQDYEHLFRQSRGLAPISGDDADAQHEQLWKATAAYSWVSDRHALDLGAEVATRTIESPDKILEDRAADDQVELFAQDAWTLGSTSLSAGLRATFNDRWGNTVSPTVGASVLPSSSLRVRTTVGRGFRAPSFKELAWDFANLGAGYTVQGFADLEPERSWNISAGLDWTPTSSSTIGVDLYTNRISNLIETVFTGNNPSGLLVYSPRNLSRARTRGLEVRAGVRTGPWTAQAEYALLDARALDDDLPLDRRAKHSGRVRTTRSVSEGSGILVSGSLTWTGEAPLVALGAGSSGGAGPADGGPLAVVGTQASFVRLDLDATFAVPGDLRLVLGVDNVFDTRPEGWQGVIARRARIGLEATSLLGR